LIPDNMGGDVPFVHTSAAKGVGIDELLDQISVVAELKELKANPNKPASGRCLRRCSTRARACWRRCWCRTAR
jgi:translation initiation factor IF-2